MLWFSLGLSLVGVARAAEGPGEEADPVVGQEPRREGRPIVEHRASLLRAHRTLEYTTATALVLTAAGGVIAAINKPTLFGDGRCVSGDPIFGDYGCNGFSLIHGTGGVLTTASYVATMTVALSVPKLPDGRGEPGPFDHGGFHRAATWVHVVGFAAMPLLGLTGAHPEMLGINGDDAQSYSETVRTVHAGVGVLTAGAFATTILIEI
jgi:hypothetical protein